MSSLYKHDLTTNPCGIPPLRGYPVGQVLVQQRSDRHARRVHGARAGRYGWLSRLVQPRR
jgi:hypothetical protein